jgi:SAM-dependent methyltransferase
VDYDPSQFRGSARHYLRGRPPYSAELASVLQRELGLDGTGHLLDVGCGPGTLALQIGPLFERVTLLEPDPEMLAEAVRNLRAAGLPAVGHVRATAEDLPALGLPLLRVVSFGQSFHRTDRARVAEAVFDALVPGGALVHVGHDGSRPAPPPPFGVPPVPRDAVTALVRRYLGPDLRSGTRLVSDYSSERHEEVLARTRFGRPRIVHAPGRPDVIRTVDEVVSGVLSMSYAAPHLFGPRLDDFVADLTALLAERTPTGTFWEWPGDTDVLIATRP